MARTIKDFHDDQIISHVMNGRMILVQDGEDTTLIVENVVHYSNSSLEGCSNGCCASTKQRKAVSQHSAKPTQKTWLSLLK